MARISKSKLDIWDTRQEVSLRKLAEDAFDQVSFDGLTDVDVLNPDADDTIFYNFSNDTWENHPWKTINGESLKGPGNITVSGGGGGTPGGTSGQFQWNDSGAFGGTSGFTWNSITSQPASANGYTFGGNSSVAENIVGLSTVASMEHRPISGLFASVELESDGSVTSIARLNTTSGATSKFLQVEVDKGSPRYFDGSGFEDVWHTGTFDPSTKQDTITAGTGLAFAGTTLSVSTNLQGWNGITTGSKQDTLVSGTNIKTVGSTSLLGSGDVPFPVTSVNTRTGAITLTDTDVPATVVTESGTSRAMANGDAGRYIRFTSGSAKTATFGTGLNVVGQEFHLRNVGANNLTLTPSSTTLNAPAGGTLVVPTGGTVTVKQVAATEFDVFGQTTVA